MKILNFTVAAFLSSGAVAATEVLEVVNFSQDSSSRMVTVEYNLQEDAIVTVDFLTNGVSIGGSRFNNVVGDVHKAVSAGNGKKIYWRPEKSWPNIRLRNVPISAKVTAWSADTPPDYMLIRIDPATSHLPASERTTYYETADALPFAGGVTNDLCKTDYLVFRKCPAANVTFRRGTNAREYNNAENWMGHLVTLTNDFYIGVFEVTQRQYEYLGTTKPKPSFFTADYAMRPVEKVSMVDLRGWCNYDPNSNPGNGKRKYWPESGHEILENDSGTSNALWRVRAITGQKFDLPTDAQWEFAAHAGLGGVVPDGYGLWDVVNGSGSAVRVGTYSRFSGSSDITVASSSAVATTPPRQGGTAVVGSYQPNAWGIYDMTGNVYEWCLDHWGKFSSDSLIDPAGPATPADGDKSKNRVMRGGAWDVGYDHCTINYREVKNGLSSASNLGFRLCLTLP
jgi:formylglycine-generating enzyme required for sulfatase activity